MQFIGRLVGTLNSVTNLFSNPHRVREVPLSEYRACPRVLEDGRMVLYRNSSAKSWDCLLISLETPQNAFRLFQVTSELEAKEAFLQYADKLRPFYESSRQALRLDALQQLTDCLRNYPDWSLAHIAVETGMRDCLKHNCIISYINSRENKEGCTPLHLACKKGDVDCIRELVDECQVRLDLVDNNAETVFHYAAKQDNFRVVEILCRQPTCGVNQVNNTGETPLHVACRLGKSDVVQAFLRSSAKCDIIGGQRYPIHTAVKYCQNGCAESILDADPSQVHSEDLLYGGTPLHWANKAEMARLLIGHGSKVNYLSKTGDSPLHIMVKFKRFDCIMVLLTNGGNPNLKGENGNTPLHLAMKLDKLVMIKALIVFGAEIDVPNDFGETPRLLAVRASKGDNRKVLLSMLHSVGAECCYPSTPDSLQQPLELPSSTCPPRPPPPHGNRGAIGFEDAVHIATALSALAYSRDTVDLSRQQQRKSDSLLCLDGGGIKGLVLIQLLLALEKAAGRPIRELFDWVSGTSTGGILALAIVHGKSMEYLRCLYFRMKAEVFKGSRPYESAPLEEFLKREFGEHTKMADVRKPKVMVTATLSDRHPAELHLFRNYDTPEIGREPPYTRTAEFRPLLKPEEQLVWRAARSSGAAPSYFRPMNRFLDGGLLANNPTLDALTEIHAYNKSLKMKDRSHEVKKLGVVVSLGTGKPPQVQVSSVDVFRPSNPWELAKTVFGAKELGKMIVDCCTESDGCTVDRAMAWCEMVDVPYFRLSPQFKTEVMLDEVDDIVLVNMLWETQIYIFQQKDQIRQLVECLLNA
ncbi:85/88 kDa calcium-independent phospholipase A2 isoform X2 [Protopterus annectens]|uniref:85/88 kDa calcium-independent phospholipase A2 isoform X2 n=1 Tax=Protopterus annectens TaxID=7888 RepID=UPI001CFA4F78|nr:85/88 kDa calcium-independent phospholipase A2 isoform X2 [Protopterus annectens]